MICTCTVDTPLGPMVGAAEAEAIIGLWFIGQKYYPAQTNHWISEPAHPAFTALRHYLADYFSGKAPALDLRLAPSGSSFQKTVWDILLKIPLGQVATYGQIAQTLSQTPGLAPTSARAVGGAVGHNPISILIPCHRVVGANGTLTGYAGGLAKKEALLRIEQVKLGQTPLRQFV